MGVAKTLISCAKLKGSPRTIKLRLEIFKKINDFLRNLIKIVCVCRRFRRPFFSKNFAKIAPGDKDKILYLGPVDSKLTWKRVNLKYKRRLTRVGLDDFNQLWK